MRIVGTAIVFAILAYGNAEIFAGEAHGLASSCVDVRSGDDVSSLLKRVNAIELRSTRQQVVAQLGSPTEELLVGRKESPEAIGKLAYYYVRRCGTSVAGDSRDKLIKLFYDVSERLVSIEGINLEVTARRVR